MTDSNGNGQGPPTGGTGESHGSRGPGRRRRKRKRKVRTRVRIKKKSHPLRKIKRVLEKLLWIAVIVAFIATLVVLMKQLDIKDEDAKKSTKKKGAFMPAPATPVPGAGTGRPAQTFVTGRTGPIGFLDRVV